MDGKILSQLLREDNPVKLGVVVPLFIIIIALIYQSFSPTFRAEEIVPLLTSVFFFSLGIYFSLSTETHNSTNQDGEIVTTKSHQSVRWLDKPPFFAWLSFGFSIIAFVVQLIIWVKRAG